MKKWPILLIFSAFIISCSPSKTPTTSATISEELLWGEWYGGPSTKYYVSGNKKTKIQDLPTGGALFIHGKDHIFINQSAKTKSLYELKDRKIYYDIDIPTQKRYYIIETLSTGALIVIGPYKDNGQLFTPGILYRITYYR